jgi:hypothetical protein
VQHEKEIVWKQMKSEKDLNKLAAKKVSRSILIIIMGNQKRFNDAL